jgi:hypothetical protein
MAMCAAEQCGSSPAISDDRPDGRATERRLSTRLLVSGIVNRQEPRKYPERPDRNWWDAGCGETARDDDPHKTRHASSGAAVSGHERVEES